MSFAAWFDHSWWHPIAGLHTYTSRGDIIALIGHRNGVIIVWVNGITCKGNIDIPSQTSSRKLNIICINCRIVFGWTLNVQEYLIHTYINSLLCSYYGVLDLVSPRVLEISGPALAELQVSWGQGAAAPPSNGLILQLNVMVVNVRAKKMRDSLAMYDIIDHLVWMARETTALCNFWTNETVTGRHACMRQCGGIRKAAKRLIMKDMVVQHERHRCRGHVLAQIEDDGVFLLSTWL
jgi:hypothetical protein